MEASGFRRSGSVGAVGLLWGSCLWLEGASFARLDSRGGCPYIVCGDALQGPTTTSFGAVGRWKSIPRRWFSFTVPGRLSEEISTFLFQDPSV